MSESCDRDFHIDETSRIIKARVAGRAMGSAQTRLTSGAWSAGVLTVVVSNDPAGNIFEDHPDAITFTSADRIKAPFRIAGYLWYGVRVSTPNATVAVAEIYLRS